MTILRLYCTNNGLLKTNMCNNNKRGYKHYVHKRWVLKQKLINSQAVCFDVDSTICMSEGIDEMAKWYGVEERIRELTNEVMNGDMLFRESLEKRLSIIRPNLKDIQTLYVPELTPYVKELIDILKAKDKDIYLISGGFYQMIVVVADMLGISTENIYCNKLMFDSDGSYNSFDKTCLTSESKGKALVIDSIKSEKKYNDVIMIGDGMTDLETKLHDPSVYFICYTHVIERKQIMEQADMHVDDFSYLIQSLNS